MLATSAAGRTHHACPLNRLLLALLASVAQDAGHSARPAHACWATASELIATGTATRSHKVNSTLATTYAYSDIRNQVDPYKSTRGPQSGYNQRNSSTAGDDSSCQTLIANNISDFCLWGSDSEL
ncbi:hypothetical protein JCM8547_007680 [Rhodosporidiobolus lusitaniae]